MKHPVLESGVRHLVWWLVWLFLGLGQSLIYYFAFGSFTNISIPDGLISVIIYSGISLMLWFPFRYFNHSVTNTGVLILNLLVSAAISVTLWAVITWFIMTSVLPWEDIYKTYWEATLPYRIGTGVFIFGLVILTYYLFISLNNLAQKNAREAKLETLVKETELKMLRSQINPHFLFNSLNSVSSLTISDPEKARTMVIKLSEFMRYALSRKDEQPVTLQSELENLRLYLDIEKVRFGDRLQVEENIDPGCLRTNLPVMILQPLYENAIKHGVYESSKKVTISTTVSQTDGYVEIIISNNFDPEATPARGTGTGLVNVSRRLELMYGYRANIKTEKQKDTFCVKIYFPADFNP
jgi:two-component system, LytTR family, sensor kinase